MGGRLYRYVGNELNAIGIVLFGLLPGRGIRGCGFEDATAGCKASDGGYGGEIFQHIVPERATGELAEGSFSEVEAERFIFCGNLEAETQDIGMGKDREKHQKCCQFDGERLARQIKGPGGAVRTGGNRGMGWRARGMRKEAKDEIVQLK